MAIEKKKLKLGDFTIIGFNFQVWLPILVICKRGNADINTTIYEREVVKYVHVHVHVHVHGVRCLRTSFCLRNFY